MDKMGDPIDAERLALLMEGRLSERDRAELLARLVHSDEAIAALGEAAALAGAMEMETEAEEAPGVIALADRASKSGTARRRVKIWVWAPIVGLAAAAVVFAVLLTRPPQRVESPLALADMLSRDELAAALALKIPPRRSLEAKGAADTRRLGMELVNLAAAAKVRNSAGMVRAAAELQRLTDDPDVKVALGRIRATPDAPEPQIRGWLEEAQGAIAGSRPAAMDGAWARAAQLAAGAEDAQFFGRREWRAALRKLETIKEAQEQAGAVRAAVPDSGVVDWPGLQNALEELVKALT